MEIHQKGNTSKNDDDDEAAEHIQFNNETNLANINLGKKNINRTKVEHNFRPPAHPDAIINFMTSL